MARVRNAEEDLKHSLRFVYPLMKLLGAWPTPATSSLFSRILDCCMIFVSYFVQSVVLVPSILYVFAKEKNTRRQMKLLVPHINGLIQIFKYTILLYRMEVLRKALDEIKEDWLSATEENRQIFREKAKIGHKVVLGVAITMYSGGLCNRTIMPLSKGRILLPNNTTIRLLPCPSYFAYFNIDEQLTPNYEIIFALQVFGGFFCYTVLSATIGVCSILSLHLSSLLRILINKMNELSNLPSTNEKAVQKKIVDIVEHRTKIKRFLKNIDQITSHMCFFEIVNDTFISCMVWYCIIMEWENSNATAITIYVILQTSCIYTNFTMCYIGQLLIDESNNVKRTSITLDWYRFPTKKARCLTLMMIISNYPVKLMAAKILEVSLSTFTDIIKASMGYLNMLRGVL